MRQIQRFGIRVHLRLVSRSNDSNVSVQARESVAMSILRSLSHGDADIA